MRALELLFPERCAVCDRPGSALCSNCRRALTRLSCARVRALWLTWRLARSALRRVLGAEARFCAGSVGNRLRRAGACIRTRVEGARAARSGTRGGGTPRRGHSAARRRGAHSRAGRPGAGMETRGRRAAGARGRAVSSLERSGGGPLEAHSRAAATAWPLASRTPPQRPRQHRFDGLRSSHGVRRRRRLHIRRDR